jgi:hypothetical protein
MLSILLFKESRKKKRGNGILMRSETAAFYMSEKVIYDMSTNPPVLIILLDTSENMM